MKTMNDPYELLDKAVLEELGDIDGQDEVTLVKDTISILCNMGLIDYDVVKEWAWEYEDSDDE